MERNQDPHRRHCPLAEPPQRERGHDLNCVGLQGLLCVERIGTVGASLRLMLFVQQYSFKTDLHFSSSASSPSVTDDYAGQYTAGDSYKSPLSVRKCLIRIQAPCSGETCQYPLDHSCSAYAMSFSKRRFLIEQIVDSKGIKSVGSYSMPTASAAVAPPIALFNRGRYGTPRQGGTRLTGYVRPLSHIYILLLHGRGQASAVLEWRRM
jgi:hypothetical protein